MNWKEEMQLLNDDQLKRIAFAEKDSWGWHYTKERNDGKSCCVLGHILDFNTDGLANYRYYSQLGYGSELELYYFKSWKDEENRINHENPKLQHPEIIEEIQNYAKQLLEERKQRVPEQVVTA